MEGSCIDLILTSTLSIHQFTNAFETGISNHHQDLAKTSYKEMFQELFRTILPARFKTRIKLSNNTDNFSYFNNEFKNTSNDYVPIKALC